MSKKYHLDTYTVEAYNDGEKKIAFHGVTSLEVGSLVVSITREGLTAIVDLEEGEE